LAHAISSLPQINSVATNLYSYQALVATQELGEIEFSLGFKPAGMTIDAATGLVQWTPTVSQIGDNFVLFKAQNIETLSFGFQLYEITVEPLPNKAPSARFKAPLSIKTGSVDRLVPIEASDPDGDVLIYEFTNLPDGLTFDADSKKIVGNVSEEFIGIYDLAVTVTDAQGGSADAETKVYVVADDGKGYEYWVGLYAGGLRNSSHPLVLLSHVDTQVEINVLGLNIQHSLNLKADKSYTINLPEEVTRVNSTKPSESFGIKITSSNPLQVTSGYFGKYGGEFTRIFEKADLGRFYTMHRAVPRLDPDYQLRHYTNIREHHTVFLATEDNTQITIKRPDHEPEEILLHKGMMYSLQKGYANNSYNGANVSSNKPIALFLFQGCVTVLSGACDNIFEQALPDKWLGTEHYIAPINNDQLGNVVAVLSTEDNNEIIFGDKKIVLQQGEDYARNLGPDNYPLKITSTNSVSVMQWISGSGHFNLPITNSDGSVEIYNKFWNEPSVTTIAAKKYWANEYWLEPVNYQVEVEWAHLIIPETAATSLTLNGKSLQSALTDKPVNNGHIWLSLKLETGVNYLKADEPFSAIQANIGFAESMSQRLDLVDDRIAQLKNITPDNELITPAGKPICSQIQVTDQNQQFMADVPVEFYNFTTQTGGQLWTDQDGILRHCETTNIIGSQRILYYGNNAIELEKNWEEFAELSAYDTPVIISEPNFFALMGEPISFQIEMAGPLAADAYQYSENKTQVRITPDGVLTWETPCALRVLPFVPRVQYNKLRVTITHKESNQQTVREYTPLCQFRKDPQQLIEYDFTVPETTFIGLPFVMQYKINSPASTYTSVVFTEARRPNFERTLLDESTIQMAPIGSTGNNEERHYKPKIVVTAGGSEWTYANSRLVTYIRNVNGNNPPSIYSKPDTSIDPEIGINYQVEFYDVDPDDSHTYRLVLGPAGMQLSDTGLLTWQPAQNNEGSHEVLLQVIDKAGAIGEQFLTINVIYTTNNAPEITSTPAKQAQVNTEYTYQVVALDPEEQQLSFALQNAPAGASISDNGLLTWTPTNEQLGQQQFAIHVADEKDIASVQFFSVMVVNSLNNTAPRFTSTPPINVSANQAVSYQLSAVDTENDPLGFMLISGDGVINANNQFTATAGVVGTQVNAVVSVTDGQFTTLQTVTIQVTDEVVEGDTEDNTGDEGAAGSIQFKIQPSSVNLGESVQAELHFGSTVQSQDQLPEHSIVFNGVDLAVTTQQVANPAGGTEFVSSASITTTNPGLQEVIANITNATAMGSITEHLNAEFVALDPSDSQAPQVTIDQPLEESSISQPTEIIGSVTDDNLQFYKVLVRKLGIQEWTQLSSGIEPVQAAVLAEIDPTLLHNGVYELALEAVDANNRKSTLIHRINISGQLKIGHFSFTVEDMQQPLSGMPISIRRTYDSRQKDVLGDFGYGWSLDYQNLTLDESRVPGQYWQRREFRSGPFNLLANFCIDPIGEPQVMVTLPNGEQETFAMQASPRCSLYQPLNQVELVFEAQDDTRATLELQNPHTFDFVNDRLSNLAAAQEFADPSKYILTTEAGFKFYIDQAVGIEKVIDPNGNTLTYTDNGISHSDGPRIDFNRNSKGLITSFSHSSGQSVNYAYDAISQLQSATDAVDATTYYIYQSDGLLTEIIDPLNRPLLKNIYNDAGRLIAQEDSAGRRTVLDHDIAGRQSLVTDRLGRSTSYYYNSRGDVTSVVNALGATTSYTYDEFGNILTATDALGRVSTNKYDELSRLIVQTDPLGNATAISYSELGLPTSMTDALGHTSTLRYDSFGNLISLTDPLNQVIAHRINLKGQVIQRNYPDQGRQTFRFDDQGHEVELTNQMGHVTTKTYTDMGLLASETKTRTVRDNERQKTTHYRYDQRNRLIEIEDALGNVTGMTYNLVGDVIAETDALGRVTKHEYDVYRRRISTTYPDGSISQNNYDAEGNLTATVDQLDRTTTYTYDALNRVIETKYPDGATTTNSYNQAGELTASTDALGNTTSFEYDLAGRLIQQTNALGDITQTVYDAEGRVIEVIDAANNTTAYEYDALDRNTAITQADESTITKVYDSMGRLVASIDATSRKTSMSYDRSGRLIQVINGLNDIWEFGYDEHSNKVLASDPLGRTTQWGYDALDRMTYHQLPLGQTQAWRYDAAGNQTAHLDFNGAESTMTFDVMDRLLEAQYADGQFKTYEYNTLGLVTQVEINQGIWNTQYDLRDRITRINNPYGQLDYTYDLNGNRADMRMTKANRIYRTQYVFDELNRLKQLTDHQNRTTTYSYNTLGDLVSRRLPNGFESLMQYNNKRIMTQMRLHNNQGDLLKVLEYQHDAQGRKTQEMMVYGPNLTGAANDWSSTSRITDYAYDQAGQLMSEAINDSQTGTAQNDFTFDEANNLIETVINGVTTQYTLDKNDRLIKAGGINYMYDAQGNMMSEILDGQTTTYLYDDLQQLVQITSPIEQTNFTYDPDGLQLTASNDQSATIWDTNRAYAEMVMQSSNGVPTYLYTHGDELISQDAANDANFDTSYIQQDAKGSSTLVSDASGAIVDGFAYQGFGEIENEINATNRLNHLYAGEYYNSQADAYNLRSRWYRPGIGRFTQMDSWPGSSSNTASYNKYLYGNGDPVNQVDPSGMFGLTEYSAAQSIRSVLVDIQVSAGSSLLDSYLGGDVAEIATNNSIVLGLGALGGAGFKILSRLSSKARKACSPKNSFTGDTLVHTEFGAKPIAEIQIGDKIWAYNVETGEQSLEEVVHLIQNEGEKTLVEIQLSTGETINATDEHPMFVAENDEQWTQAKSLKQGDQLLSRDGIEIPIQRLTTKLELVTVYNLTVDQLHNYYVGEQGVLGHNTDCFKIDITSRIKESSLLVREAKRTGNSIQKEIDSLTKKLSDGNINPGIGNKSIGNGILESRTRNGGRVYWRPSGSNKLEILGKSGKGNQQKVINELFKVFGKN